MQTPIRLQVEFDDQKLIFTPEEYLHFIKTAVINNKDILVFKTSVIYG